MSKTIEQLEAELKHALEQASRARSATMIARKAKDKADAKREEERWRLEGLRLQRILENRRAEA